MAMVASLESRKLRIIDSIVELRNEHIVLLIEALLDSETDFWDQLTPKQRIRIEQAIQALDSGQGIPHESVMLKMRKKLNQ